MKLDIFLERRPLRRDVCKGDELLGVWYRKFTQIQISPLKNSEDLTAFELRTCWTDIRGWLQYTGTQEKRMEQHKIKFLLEATFFSYIAGALGRALFFRPQFPEHVQKQYF